jgi:hypothetical protein
MHARLPPEILETIHIYAVKTSERMYIRIHTHIHVYMCICVYACIYVDIPKYIHVYT